MATTSGSSAGKLSADKLDVIRGLAADLDLIQDRISRMATNSEAGPSESAGSAMVRSMQPQNNNPATEGRPQNLGLPALTRLQDVIQSPLSPTVLEPLPKRTDRVPSVMRRLNDTASAFADHQFYFDLEESSNNMQESGLMDDSMFWDRSYGFGNGRPSTSKTEFTPADPMLQSGEDSSGISSCVAVDSLQPTHRVTHQFVPRHSDEVMLDVGDPVYVERETDDLWYIGVNLRTGQRGIFPEAYAFEIDFEQDCGPMSNLRLTDQDRATFYLTFLGTVEVAHHKGNDTLIQAINKVLRFYQNKEENVVPYSVLLDISYRGIHIIDKSRKNWFQCPNFDYFYGLQNVSFCGSHPKQSRYFGFIIKHTLLPRFACNVFLSNTSTQPVVDAIGRAFKRSYDEYMAYAHPTEDIFIE